MYISFGIISQLLGNFALKIGEHTNKQTLLTSIQLDLEKKTICFIEGNYKTMLFFHSQNRLEKAWAFKG